MAWKQFTELCSSLISRRNKKQYRWMVVTNVIMVTIEVEVLVAETKVVEVL